MPATGKTLHILGAGQWQLPTIRLAKALGHRVLVTDIYAERPGYALADAHEVIDISDRERTLEAAQRHRVDGVLCDTTDAGVPTAAYVAEQLGLPGIGYETALNFTNKARMRAICARAGIPGARFRVVSSPAELREAADELGYPVVVKPPDSQSSRGVTRIDGPDQLGAAFVAALGFTRGGAVLVEEFLPGTEVTVEGFGQGGTYLTTGISDKGHFAHRPTVANRLTYPAGFDAATLDRIRTTNEAVVRALGLVDGVTHAEYMVHEGQVRLVEIAARGGGSRIHSDIVPYVSGIDVMRAGVEFALGASRPATPICEPRAANLAFFEFPAGRVAAVEGLDEARQLPGVHEILLEFSPGDTLHPPEDDRSRPGLVVVFGTTRAEVLATSDRVTELVRVRIA